MPDFELVTARIRTDNGLEGLGYTYTVGRGGSAILALLTTDLAPLLIGEDPRRTEFLWDRLWWAIHWVGRGGVASFSMAALDVAVWDLKAKAVGEPLWRLLGGTRTRVSAYAGGIDLHFSREQLERQTEGFLDAGFRAIKIKAGRESLAEDIERVRLVRSIVGPSFTLMADANCRWRTDQAIRAARALAPFDLTWLEEPTIPDDVEGFARIAAEGGVPVATGENMHTAYEFERMIRCGDIAFAQPDLSNLGGITPWLQVAKLAQARHLPVSSHGVHDLHVHLLAAVPNGSYLEVHGFGLERFQDTPLAFADGMAIVPDRAGHGVDLRPALLRPFLVSQNEVTSSYGSSHPQDLEPTAR